MMNMLAEASMTVPAIDFSAELTTALQGIQADFVKYAGIAIGVGFAIWAAPQAIRLVKKFFKSLTS